MHVNAKLRRWPCAGGAHHGGVECVRCANPSDLWRRCVAVPGRALQLWISREAWSLDEVPWTAATRRWIRIEWQVQFEFFTGYCWYISSAASSCRAGLTRWVFARFQRFSLPLSGPRRRCGSSVGGVAGATWTVLKRSDDDGGWRLHHVVWSIKLYLLQHLQELKA